ELRPAALQVRGEARVDVAGNARIEHAPAALEDIKPPARRHGAIVLERGETRMRPRTALLIASSALACACAPLATHFPGESRNAQFVRDIAQANLAEIAAGRLALEKARSRAVRRF